MQDEKIFNKPLKTVRDCLEGYSNEIADFIRSYEATGNIPDRIFPEIRVLERVSRQVPVLKLISCINHLYQNVPRLECIEQSRVNPSFYILAKEVGNAVLSGKEFSFDDHGLDEKQVLKDLMPKKGKRFLPDEDYRLFLENNPFSDFNMEWYSKLVDAYSSSTRKRNLLLNPEGVTTIGHEPKRVQDNSVFGSIDELFSEDISIDKKGKFYFENNKNLVFVKVDTEGNVSRLAIRGMNENTAPEEVKEYGPFCKRRKINISPSDIRLNHGGFNPLIPNLAIENKEGHYWIRLFCDDEYCRPVLRVEREGKEIAYKGKDIMLEDKDRIIYSSNSLEMIFREGNPQRFIDKYDELVERAKSSENISKGDSATIRLIKGFTSMIYPNKD